MKGSENFLMEKILLTMIHNIPQYSSIAFLYVASIIKMSGSESQGQEKAACMRIFKPMQPL